jgi:hypothetical protein
MHHHLDAITTPLSVIVIGNVEPVKDCGEPLCGELRYRCRAGALLARGEDDLGAAGCELAADFEADDICDQFGWEVADMGKVEAARSPTLHPRTAC